MFFFSFSDKVDIVKIFLEKKPELINLKDDEGYTPITYTAKSNGK